MTTLYKKLFILLAIAVTLTATGCTSTSNKVEPYTQFTVGYIINQQNYQSRYAGCDVAFQFAAGVKINDKHRVGFAHDSQLDCGPPFDDRKEPHRDFFYYTREVDVVGLFK